MKTPPNVDALKGGHSTQHQQVIEHRRGVSDVAGLYFLGLPFLTKLSSSFLFGVGDDAAWLAEHMDAASPA